MFLISFFFFLFMFVIPIPIFFPPKKDKIKVKTHSNIRNQHTNIHRIRILTITDHSKSRLARIRRNDTPHETRRRRAE